MHKNSYGCRFLDDLGSPKTHKIFVGEDVLSKACQDLFSGQDADIDNYTNGQAENDLSTADDLHCLDNVDLSRFLDSPDSSEGKSLCIEIRFFTFNPVSVLVVYNRGQWCA